MFKKSSAKFSIYTAAQAYISKSTFVVGERNVFSYKVEHSMNSFVLHGCNEATQFLKIDSQRSNETQGEPAEICAGQVLGTIGDEIADQAPVPRELFAATRNT